MSNSLETQSKLIEKSIIEALQTSFSEDSFREERFFRKDFHTQFFKNLKVIWNENDKIKTKISVKYGLIHNSVHATVVDQTCEIADFLFVVKHNNCSYREKSLLLQVKASGVPDDNKRQKNLYANWPEFKIFRPNKEVFLNGQATINITKQKSQSVYFEYPKNNPRSADKYTVKEIKTSSERPGAFDLYEQKNFSAFLLNLFFHNEGRSFLCSEEFDLTYKKYYHRKTILNDLLYDLSHGIHFADDWDFLINSVLNYSNGKLSMGVDRQPTAVLGFIPLTGSSRALEDAELKFNAGTKEDGEPKEPLRIVEINIENK